jgi:undecaprenyl diphosphate synthase
MVPGGPVHVGLIPDGMRRWARANDTTLAESYRRGADKVADILAALQQRDVRTVSLFGLSRVNLGRRPEELLPIYQAAIHLCVSALPEKIDPATCTVHLIGDRTSLPEKLLSGLENLESAMHSGDFTINLLGAYDAFDELRRAHDRANATGGDIAAALEVSEVDLVIRTSPESLLSGFLPLQCQYAELHFLQTPLNELETSEIDEIIATFRRLPQLRGR